MSELSSVTADAQRQEPPHARPVFRVLAGLFALFAALVPYTVLAALLRGEPAPDTSVFGGMVESLAFALMTGAFAAVAITGRVPMWLFRVWARAS